MSAQVRPKATYATYGGQTVYVHSVVGDRVTFNYVGSTDSREASLRRFLPQLLREVITE